MKTQAYARCRQCRENVCNGLADICDDCIRKNATQNRLKKAAKIAAEQLLTVADEGYSLLTGEERDAIGLVRFVCHEIEDGDR